jgi:putative transposase
MHAAALRQRVRVRLERNPQPSAGDSGHPVGQDDRGGRRSARLRRWQEGQGKRAPSSSSGHARFGAQSQKVHNAKVQDREGIKISLDLAAEQLPERLSHLWMDAGYTGEGRGADRVQRMLGWTAEIVRHPPKLAPEEVMRRWVKEWAKEGVAIDPEKLSGPRRFSEICLGDGWSSVHLLVVGTQPSYEKDYERLAATSETFVYVAMSRLMVRRLARA